MSEHTMSKVLLLVGGFTAGFFISWGFSNRSPPTKPVLAECAYSEVQEQCLDKLIIGKLDIIMDYVSGAEIDHGQIKMLLGASDEEGK